MSRYIIYGSESSNHTIIAFPALGERKEMYEFLASYLNEFKVVAIDLPGHNQSIQVDYSIDIFITEVKNILTKLNITSAHFIGNSIGAWIIQAFYSKFPEYVKSLTLLDGGYYFLGEREEFEEEIQLPVIERLEDLENALSETVNAMENLTEEVRNNFRQYLKDNFLFKNNLYIHHSNEQAINSLSKEITMKDYCLKKETDIPFLLLLAEHSMDDFSQAKIAQFKQLHPKAIIHQITKGYHFLPITNLEEVAKILNETYIECSTL